MSKKYYAVLVGAQVEPECSWERHHLIYSSLREAKDAFSYWTDPENFDRVSKCKIVEIKLGKEVKLKKGAWPMKHNWKYDGTMTLPTKRKGKKK